MLVAVCVNMPCKHRHFISKGRIQWIILREDFSAEAMPMLVIMILVTVAMRTLFQKIEPCRDGDPATKHHECETRSRIDNAAETVCKSDTCEPYDYSDEQC